MNRLDELLAISVQEHAAMCYRQIWWAIAGDSDANDICFWQERYATWAAKARELMGV